MARRRLHTLPRVSPLQSLRHPEPHRKSLSKGWLRIRYYMCLVREIDFSLDMTVVDEELNPFVNYAWEKKWPFHLARAAILAIQYWKPHLRFNLGATWASLSTWNNQREWRPRVPYPQEIMLLILLTAIRLGMEETSCMKSRRWATMGVLIRLMFYGLLRPGEAFRLRPTDVLFTAGPDGSLIAIVAIVAPKTAKVIGAGRVQSVAIYDLGTVLWLQYLCSCLPIDSSIWSFSSALFRLLFITLMKTAGVAHLGFTPAS